MRQLVILTLFCSLVLIQTAFARTIEVDVYGMTCAFCVYSLERKFGKMDSVSDVQVSLKEKKLRLETDEKHPSIDIIKQTIIDAGFTPVRINEISGEQQ